MGIARYRFDWRVKWAVDTFKSSLPFQKLLRRTKHKLLGHSPPLQKFKNYVPEAVEQVLSLKVHDSVVVEIGSGWEPIFPIVYRLAGAKKVYLTDLYPLLSNESLASTVSFFRRNIEMLPGQLQRSDLLPDLTGDLEIDLRNLGMEYLAPCDCRQMPLPDASVDIVFSHDTFEHIPPDALSGILRDAHRVLVPGGLTVHLIDHSDHWEHSDKNLSPINCLRFGEVAWNVLSLNPQNYQNRLRHSDYVRMFEESGFELMVVKAQPSPKALAALPSIPLAARFTAYSPDDLCTLSSWILARKNS